MPIVGNEISIPPLTITIRTPNANMSCTIEERKISKMLAMLKKDGLFIPIIDDKTIIANIRMVSLRRNNLLKFIINLTPYIEHLPSSVLR